MKNEDIREDFTDDLIDMIDTVHYYSPNPFFLTDTLGNMLWRNQDCNDQIIFTGEFNDRYKIQGVIHKGISSVAERTDIEYNGETFYLWKIESANENLSKLGLSDELAVLEAKFDKISSNSDRTDTSLNKLTDIVYGKVRSESDKIIFNRVTDILNAVKANGKDRYIKINFERGENINSGTSLYSDSPFAHCLLYHFLKNAIIESGEKQFIADIKYSGELCEISVIHSKNTSDKECENVIPIVLPRPYTAKDKSDWEIDEIAGLMLSNINFDN